MLNIVSGAFTSEIKRLLPPDRSATAGVCGSQLPDATSFATRKRSCGPPGERWVGGGRWLKIRVWPVARRASGGIPVDIHGWSRYRWESRGPGWGDRSHNEHFLSSGLMSQVSQGLTVVVSIFSLALENTVSKAELRTL